MSAPRREATVDVTASLWRALAALRLLLVAFAIVVSALQWREYAIPALAGAILAVIAAWSVFTSWWYARPTRRSAPVLAADMAVALGSLLGTPYAEGTAMLAQNAPTVPTYWVAAPVLACAIHWGWQGGLVAALVEGVVDTSIRAQVIGTTLGNLFLLCVAAVVAGYSASLVCFAAAQRAETTALAAANAERERLGRAVHDGVLQVLAYVQRRGHEIGGQAAELARLAGEQEEALRALIHSTPDGAQGQTRDVAALLRELGSAPVSVATPGEPVPLPAAAATELVAAAREAVANAGRHATGADVYVLLEDEGDAVTISVRDNGPGIPDGRLAAAAGDGRMGVPESIVGRVEQLGGTPTLRTEPGGGTEWELRVPRKVGP